MKNQRLTYILLGAIGVLCAVIIALIPVLVNVINAGDGYIPEIFETPEPEETAIPTATPFVNKSATICATGDLLMHQTVMDAYKFNSYYNFDGMFKYISQKVSSADYAVANLETTLRGENDGYSFSGYPAFNCPDEIVDSAKKAGFDMLLTANNHSFDTGYKGMVRTVQVVNEKGLDTLGIVDDVSKKNYIVKDINGIKVGMICYTYETENKRGKVALNGIPLGNQSAELVNTFSYGELDSFFKKIEGQMESMVNDGAEALVLFIHWGEEYQLKQNKNQEKIAQKMCDLGFDVIVGGHPHVVQPVELLTSQVDENHKTVCLYSMGNAVSNQRKEQLNGDTQHTEDGVLFFFTFEKSEKGVNLSKVDIVPLWVNKFKADGRNNYEMIAIDDSVSVSNDFSKSAKDQLNASYARTNKIVGAGLKGVKEYLEK